MSQRKKIIAANWKMYKDLAESNDFFTFFIENLQDTKAEILIAPSFTNLWHAFDATREYPIEIVAQNMHESEEGAFTGEVSAKMLKSIGIERVILGHSERREYFAETDRILSEKVRTALANEIKIIFCIGEKLEDRKDGDHFKLVESQLRNGLFHLNAKQWESVVIAYEPVWAIGTGETASPEQAQEMHQFIRKTIADKYSNEVSDNVSILYGGSVKPANAKDLFAQPDIDGALVGGASLEVESFIDIISAL
ncbi:triose-phosphate isomerase [Planktosalinus lacus]|uniref:Triosephosphate isomerase n=1 Tax=Planktosalinus lacus TaxID=1526573 RepID=A0A8J2VE91_9FLAO|nr:triose-phosphate isomerase [Planktosalinus lacus]GGD99673.1 triosephosphate isomerase [Planktosalinus lacus]